MESVLLQKEFQELMNLRAHLTQLVEDYYTENEEGYYAYRLDEEGCAEDCVCGVSRAHDWLEKNGDIIALGFMMKHRLDTDVGEESTQRDKGKKRKRT